MSDEEFAMPPKSDNPADVLLIEAGRQPRYVRPNLKHMLDAIPPKVEAAQHDADAEIAAAAAAAANRRSEARRDAVLAVALAIARRGQNPVSDWTTRDTDTAYAIADMLIALG
jgi:hypothetical protein